MQRVVLLAVLAIIPAMGLHVVQLNPTEKCEVPAGFHRLPTLPKSSREEQTPAEVAGDNMGNQKMGKIYFINVEHDHARYRSITAQLAKWAPSTEAVWWHASTKKDARGMMHNKEEREKYSTKSIDPEVPVGSVATYMSHYNVIKKIAEEKDPNVVHFVLEDDVAIHDNDFVQNTICEIQQLPADWDVYKFGYWDQRQIDSSAAVIAMKDPSWQIHGSSQSCDGGRSINRYSCQLSHHTFTYMGNQAYAMRASGAKAMLAHLHEFQITDIDGAMMPGQHGKAPDTNVYVRKHTIMGHNKFESTRLVEAGLTEEQIQEIEDTAGQKDA